MECEKCEVYRALIKEYVRRISIVEKALLEFIGDKSKGYIARNALGIKDQNKKG